MVLLFQLYMHALMNKSLLPIIMVINIYMCWVCQEHGNIEAMTTPVNHSLHTYTFESKPPHSRTVFTAYPGACTWVYYKFGSSDNMHDVFIVHLQLNSLQTSHHLSHSPTTKWIIMSVSIIWSHDCLQNSSNILVIFFHKQSLWAVILNTPWQPILWSCFIYPYAF